MKFWKGHADQRGYLVWTEVVEQMEFQSDEDQFLWTAKIGTYLKRSYIQLQPTMNDACRMFAHFQRGILAHHFINKLAAVISDDTMASLIRRKLSHDHEATITAVINNLTDEALAELIKVNLSVNREATMQMFAAAVIATAPKEPEAETAPVEEQEKEEA